MSMGKDDGKPTILFKQKKRTGEGVATNPGRTGFGTTLGSTGVGMGRAKGEVSPPHSSSKK